MFMDAYRAMLLRDLACIKCSAINLQPPAKPTVDVDDTGRAACDQCGQVWMIKGKP